MCLYYLDHLMCSTLDCGWCTKDGEMVPYKSSRPRIYYCAPRAEGDLAADGLPVYIMNPEDPNCDIMIQYIWRGWCDKCWREWWEEQKTDDCP